jgi:hypothetical protein
LNGLSSKIVTRIARIYFVKTRIKADLKIIKP